MTGGCLKGNRPSGKRNLFSRSHLSCKYKCSSLTTSSLFRFTEYEILSKRKSSMQSPIPSLFCFCESILCFSGISDWYNLKKKVNRERMPAKTRTTPSRKRSREKSGFIGGESACPLIGGFPAANATFFRESVEMFMICSQNNTFPRHTIPAMLCGSVCWYSRNLNNGSDLIDWCYKTWLHTARGHGKISMESILWFLAIHKAPWKHERIPWLYASY